MLPVRDQKTNGLEIHAAQTREIERDMPRGARDFVDDAPQLRDAVGTEITDQRDAGRAGRHRKGGR